MELKDDDRFDRLISKALENENSFELRPDFADRVVAMAERRMVKKEVSRDKWWLVAGITSLIGAAVFVLSQIKISVPRPGVGVFTFVQSYWGLFVFGILFITALHFIDKLILRKQESG